MVRHIPAAITTSDSMKTRLGTLKFFDDSSSAKGDIMKSTNFRTLSRTAVAFAMSTVLLWILLAFPVSAQKKEKERLQSCAKVLREILDIPDDVPKDVMDKAECVLVLPGVRKSSFLLGGSYGRGAMSCRSGQNFDGPWSPPAMYRLVGLSVGFQFGGESTDFVILVMNERGAAAMLKSKIKLGSDASIAAGPKGRTVEAATQGTM